MIIYHNSRCKKSRDTLGMINSNGGDVEIREYLKEPLSKVELIRIVQLLGISPQELIRKNESVYKENYKGKELTEDQWIDAMVQCPKLIQRPIVVKGDKAILGRPPESVLSLFS